MPPRRAIATTAFAWPMSMPMQDMVVSYGLRAGALGGEQSKLGPFWKPGAEELVWALRRRRIAPAALRGRFGWRLS